MSYTTFEVLAIAGRGLLLGLSVGPSCLGHCGPLIVPFMLSEGGGAKRNRGAIVRFCSGRLFGYLIVGFISGYAGLRLRNFAEVRLMGMALILSSLLLIMYSIGKSFPTLRFCHIVTSKRSLMQMPLFFGFLTGLNLCPPFLVGLSEILIGGTPIKGMIFFFAFFLATLAYIIPLLFLGFLEGEKLRKFGQATGLIAGFWFLYLGVRTFILNA